MKRARAFTLSETLISLGLFGSFLAAICLLYTEVFQALRTYEEPMRDKQKIYRTFHHVASALRSTRCLVQPNYYQLFLASSGGSGLVIKENGQVVGYRQVGSELERILYRPDYDPSVPATHQPLEPPRKILQGVRQFGFALASWQKRTLVRLWLEVGLPSRERIYLQTAVNFREAQ